MADVPHPPGPAEPQRSEQRRREVPQENSFVIGGLASIFAVTLATCAVALVGALTALVVSWIF